MKKVAFFVLLVVGMLASSLGMAQTSGFGIYGGTYESIGVQKQQGDLRFSVGIAGLWNNGVALSGSVDSMLGKSRLTERTSASAIDLYYGLGATGTVALGTNVASFSLFPHALGGLLFTLDGMEKYPFYFELQAGPSFSGAGTNFPVVAGRFGVILK